MRLRQTSLISGHSSARWFSEDESWGSQGPFAPVLTNFKLATSPAQHWQRPKLSHRCHCRKDSPCFLSGWHLIHILFIPLLIGWNIHIPRNWGYKRNSSKTRICNLVCLCVCVCVCVCVCKCLVAQCVWLFVTPWTVVHQAPLSIGFPQARVLEWVAMPLSRGYIYTHTNTYKLYTHINIYIHTYIHTCIFH